LLDSIQGVIVDSKDKFVPLRTPQNANKPMWISHKALKCVRKKNKVFSKYKDRNHPAVRKANSKAKAALKKARHLFEKKLASSIKCDKKSFYAYARSKAKSKIQISSVFDDKGRQIHDDSQMAEAFNAYFTSVFTREDVSSLPDPVNIFKGSDGEKLLDVVFTADDVKVQLNKLRVDKAPGVDGPSPRFLMEIKNEIVHPLFILFKKSLDTTCIPEDWKCANVTPVYKKRSQESRREL